MGNNVNNVNNVNLNYEDSFGSRRLDIGFVMSSELEYIHPERFEKAKVLLDNLLRCEMPDKDVIGFLYRGREDVFFDHIRNFYEKRFRAGFDLNEWKLRQHIKNPPNEIYSKMAVAEINKSSGRNQYNLLSDKGIIPYLGDMKVLFGDYAENVRRVYEMFLNEGIKRKGGVSAATHNYSVACVAYDLFSDDPRADRCKYSAEAGLHDSIEDLLPSSRDYSGTPYGLIRFDDFVRENIHEDLRMNVITLTNYYDLVLNYIEHKFKRRGVRPNLDDLLNELKKLGDIEFSYKPEDKSVNKSEDKSEHQKQSHFECRPVKYIEDSISKLENNVSNGDLLEDLRSLCYAKYIRDIATKCNEEDNLRTYEIKGIDISDNRHTVGDLGIESKIKIILKEVIWATEARLLNSKWAPLNNHADELTEDALSTAKSLIIAKLAKPNTLQRTFKVALNKIEELDIVFYENRYDLF